MHMCSLSLGNFVSLCEWAHLLDKTVPTALTQQYTKLVVKFSAQPPLCTLLRSLNISLTLQANPTVQSFDSGWECHRMNTWLTLCLAVLLPVCLSGQLTCNSINIHNRNNNNNYDSGCYLEPSADTHIFGGSRSPFCTAPRPFIVCIVCFCLLCVFVCMSTVCLAATCSPQAKILALTNPLPSPF